MAKTPKTSSKTAAKKAKLDPTDWLKDTPDVKPYKVVRTLQIIPGGVYFNATKMNIALAGLYRLVDAGYQRILNKAAGSGLHDDELNAQVRLAVTSLNTLKAVVDLIPYAEKADEVPDEDGLCVYSAPEAFRYLGELMCTVTKDNGPSAFDPID